VKRDDIISAVAQLQALEAEEAEAERLASPRRKRITELRIFLDKLAGAQIERPRLKSFEGIRRREAPRQDAIRRLIMRKPDAGYRDIVKELYGEYTDQAVLKARSIISLMKKAKQLSGDPGRWRVLQPTTSNNNSDDEESDSAAATSPPAFG